MIWTYPTQAINGNGKKTFGYADWWRIKRKGWDEEDMDGGIKNSYEEV